MNNITENEKHLIEIIKKYRRLSRIICDCDDDDYNKYEETIEELQKLDDEVIILKS